MARAKKANTNKQDTAGSSSRIDLSKNRLQFPLPNLIEAQVDSYSKFLNEDLVKHFQLINPITDNTGKLWSLEFLKPSFKKPERTENECIKKGLTYEVPLYWEVRLVNKQTGEAKEQEIFMGNVPLMTDRGTYIITGVERCIVHQVIRSEGVVFAYNNLFNNGNPLVQAKIIPSRGAWLTLDTSKTGLLTIKLGPKRPKVNFATFLRAMGYGSDDEIRNLFKNIQLPEEQTNFLEITLSKDPTDSTVSAIFDLYKRLRPDVAASVESAKGYLDALLFDPKRLYLGDVGRYQLNKKLEEKYSKEMSEENYALTIYDIIATAEKLLKINYGLIEPDDMDHLGNRRLRSVNELLGEVVIDAVRKIEKNTKDKMSLHSTDELLTANDVLSSRPLVTSLRDFFGTSQISRYMNQKNVLAEISNLRHITAAGPGGLSKERATFSVRDVHYSQYGRFCPVQTPDGPSIGIVNYLASYARVNAFGFLEVPYRKIEKSVTAKYAEGRILAEDVSEGTKVVLKAGTKLTAKDIEKVDAKTVLHTVPFVSSEVVYMDADEESKYKMTLSELQMDDELNILQSEVPVRYKGDFYSGSIEDVEFIDVDPAISAGVNFTLMPFGNHTDPARSLIEATNMNQAVPLVFPQTPIIGTGREEEVARLSGRSIYAKYNATVDFVDATKVVLVDEDGNKEEIQFTKFQASNGNTIIDHTVKVGLGQKLKAGDLIADGSSAHNGELSIGTNILCACMFYEGKTFEDGWAISERLMRENVLDGVIIKTYTRDIRDTKLGPEQLTADIPGVNKNLLANLGSDGVIRKGAKVKSGDILAGVISPKGDVEITPEEKLLRAIFGESAHDVKDVSLRLPNGESSIVIDYQILDRTEEELTTGVLKQVKVWVAKIHTINLGDKLCDMAGQKGVIAHIVPEEDMPFMEDGTPVDLIFTPLFLKRMNVSILREMNLAMKAHRAGVKVKVPLFTQPDETPIDEMLKEMGITHSDKVVLRDGRTGEPFDQPVSVGMKYILKIEHLAEDKIHARSTGPYTIVTQQPLGGKAQFGGQRFGEMEVWALEAHDASKTLQEMLTIKSDDVDGRSNAYEAIIHGEKAQMDGVPESFRVLVNELRALGLNITLVGDSGEEVNYFN